MSTETFRNPPPAGPGAGTALLGYAVLSVLLTWPLAVHLADRLPLGNNDLWQNVWNFWWWKTAVFGEGASPYHTRLIFYPTGASLAFHTHSEGNVFLTAPVLLLLGPVAALNVATLGSFILAGWAGYLLCREVVGDRSASFLGGIVFAFFPQHFHQSLEHLNLSSYGAMALFLWGLLRGVRRGGLASWSLCAVFFALNALFSWHNGVLILPGALLLFFWELARGERPRFRVVLEASGAAVIALLLLLPFAWPMLREILAGETYFLKPHVDKPIDLLFLLVPSEHHTLWGGLFSPLYELRPYRSVGFTAYTGWVALALGTAAVVLDLRRRGYDDRRGGGLEARSFSLPLWILFFALYIILALGDGLRVAGWETGIPLPFALLRELPLFETSRVANRFLVPAMLGLGVLAARGVSRLARIARRPRLFLAGATLLLIVDMLWIPYPLRDVLHPEWVKHVSEAPPGAVLNIPGGYRARASVDMFLQTYHDRPIVGGYVSATPPAARELIDAYPVVRTIFEGRPDPRREVPLEEGLQRLLDDLPIGLVALHLDRIREDLEALEARHRGRPEERLYNPEKGIPREKLRGIRRFLRAYWGEPYYRDARTELYRRP